MKAVVATKINVTRVAFPALIVFVFINAAGVWSRVSAHPRFPSTGRFAPTILKQSLHPVVGDTVTTGTLLQEMSNLSRLSSFAGNNSYKTVQFSSYDRSSISADKPGWFSNSDGFGGATHPAFEKVLVAPDSSGIGTYLVCDIRQPGAIVRLWTAKHTGSIKLYLDGSKEPVFNGPAEDFYWKFNAVVSGGRYPAQYDKVFRQYDAVYFPIAFAKGCRIEWTGNTKEVHFYQVDVRLYEQGVTVKTFSPQDYLLYQSTITHTYQLLSVNKGSDAAEVSTAPTTHQLKPQSRKDVLLSQGNQEMTYFSLKIGAKNVERVLRQTVLSIYFDGAATPQVHIPAGDFFGAAPGINPFESLPFAVKSDGTMICRFPMPFKSSIRVELENQSNENINVTINAGFKPHRWVEEESMYFYARWRVDHDIHASSTIVQDMPYLMARGKGRLVGIATHLFNPSPIPTGYGSWWGEGDEKIFVDNDTFPSFFGTGSEDYYNYSWSADKIFYYPYCGQPRDDGPSTHGFVSNFRWHIIDDIPFQSAISFFMELFSHTEVPGMSYARAAYFYAIPGVVTELVRLSPDQLRQVKTPRWRPEATHGAADFKFFEAEQLIKGKNAHIKSHRHYVWSDSTLLLWTPAAKGERITLRLPAVDVAKNKELALTLGMLPDGGKIKVYLNGKQIYLEGKDLIDLQTEGQTMLRTFWAVGVDMNKEKNELELEFAGDVKNNKIGIDFLWLKK